MSLDNLDAIDWLAVDPEKGLVDLAIVDDRDWLNAHLHLVSLQDKINSYIGAIEEGEIAELAAARTPKPKKQGQWLVKIPSRVLRSEVWRALLSCLRECA